MKVIYKTVWAVTDLLEKRHARGLKRVPCFGDDQMIAVRSALIRGDWAPLREALASAGKNWDRRAWLVAVATNSERKREPAWVADWLAQEPEKSAPHLMAGAALIDVAWAIRGGGRAVTVSRRSFDQFFETLTRAERHLHTAAKAAPSDPTPWGNLIQSGIGLQLDREQIEARFADLVRRDPNDVYGHMRMLQFNCKKWFGSFEQMWKFARGATANLPMGSLRYLLIPAAHVEQIIDSEPEDEEDPVAGYYRNPHVRKEIFSAYEKMSIDPPLALSVAINAYNYFAHALWRCGARQAAAGAFRILDDRMTDIPWSYEGGAKVFKRAKRETMG